MTIEWGYLIPLGVLWFLFYWILGGAFFALISVFRLGKLYKGRFSCAFSLVALASAFASAWFGMSWAHTSAVDCLKVAEGNVEGFVGFFGCSIIALTVSFLGGALIVLVLGAAAMRLSSIKIILPQREQVEDSDVKKKNGRDISPLT